MRLLLDTHILLWWLDDLQLGPRADGMISDQRNEIFVSAISLWEIAIKSQLGKLRADVDRVKATAQESGFRSLPFTLDHATAVARLPSHHRDPFDRALLAQALTEPLNLLTHDERLAVYGQHVLLV